MPHQSTIPIVNVVAGGCLGGLIFLVLGVVAGGWIGWRVAFNESDGANQVVYQDGQPEPLSMDFWAVFYDEHDNPILRRSRAPRIDLDETEITHPASPSRTSTGPWEGSMPAGDHTFHAGGVSFDRQDGWIDAQLVLYPEHPRDGWIREYHRYRILPDSIRVTSIERERAFNEWGLEVVFFYTAIITLASCLFGTILGAGVGPLIKPHQRYTPAE